MVGGDAWDVALDWGLHILLSAQHIYRFFTDLWKMTLRQNAMLLLELFFNRNSRNWLNDARCRWRVLRWSVLAHRLADAVWWTWHLVELCARICIIFSGATLVDRLIVRLSTFLNCIDLVSDQVLCNVKLENLIIGNISYSEQVSVQVLILHGDSMHMLIALALKQVYLVLDEAWEQTVELGSVFRLYRGSAGIAPFLSVVESG